MAAGRCWRGEQPGLNCQPLSPGNLEHGLSFGGWCLQQQQTGVAAGEQVLTERFEVLGSAEEGAVNVAAAEQEVLTQSFGPLDRRSACTYSRTARADALFWAVEWAVVGAVHICSQYVDCLCLQGSAGVAEGCTGMPYKNVA